MAHATPLGGPLLTRTTVIAGILAAIAAALAIYRFAYGLGAVTNLNNGYAWGLWIVWDVVVGTALGCGGFAIALVVYVMNKGQYHPLVRPALTASVFGYSLGGVSVILDLGRYWNIWHLYVPGYFNSSSVMFEVAACITAYTLVLWIEFMPVLTERFKTPSLRKMVNKTLFFFIALGVLLPTMHQSSLGSMLVVFGFHVHPLWQSDLLPLLFLLSVLAMGYAVVIFEATLVSKAYRRPSEAHLLGALGFYVMVLTAFFLVVRWADIIANRKLDLVFSSGTLSSLFWVENVLFLLPVLWLSGEKMRANARLQFMAATCLLLGGILYRIDAYLVAQVRPGWHYFPAGSELLVTIGIVAFEVLAYVVLVKTLPILHSVRK